MPTMTIRNLPVEVHQAIRTRARAHGHSAEAEVRAILEEATRPGHGVGLGSALAALGAKYGVVTYEPASREEPMRIADLP